jgi:hypothetical protein
MSVPWYDDAVNRRVRSGQVKFELKTSLPTSVSHDLQHNTRVYQRLSFTLQRSNDYSISLVVADCASSF